MIFLALSAWNYGSFLCYVAVEKNTPVFLFPLAMFHLVENWQILNMLSVFTYQFRQSLFFSIHITYFSHVTSLKNIDKITLSEAPFPTFTVFAVTTIIFEFCLQKKMSIFLYL